MARASSHSGSRAGKAIIEYALLLALIACVVIPGLVLLGQRADRVFRSVFGTPEGPAMAAGGPGGSPRVASAGGAGAPVVTAQAPQAKPPAPVEPKAAATGKTYYVDAQAGDDAKDGLSMATAWKSLAKIKATALSPGDRVLLKKGCTWRETLQVPSSGAEGSPITFGSYGTGDEPRIVGADAVTGWKAFQNNVWVASLATEPFQVFFDGVRGARKDARAKLAADGDWYWEPNSLYVYRAAAPDGTLVEASVRDCVFAWQRSHIRLEGLCLLKGHYGLYLGQCSNVACVGTESAWHYYDGLMADGTQTSNVTFTSCKVHDTLRHGIHAHDASNVTVEGGEFYGCSQKYGAGVGFNGVQGGTISGVGGRDNYYGVKVANAAADVVVSRCSAHHNASFGIDVDIDTQRIRVEQNTVHENGSHGIAVEWNSRDCVVTRNLCYRNGQQSAGIFIEMTTGTVVSYNVVHDEYIGIRFNEQCRNCSAYNNVLYAIGGVGLSAFNNCSGIALKNNIAHSCALAVHVRPDSQAGFVSDHNDWWVTGKKLEWGWDYMPFEEWRAATGQDAHSLCADPGFVNAAGLDFHLQPDSPCIDAGADVGLTADYDGRAVPQGQGPDIGAHEDQGAGGNIPPAAVLVAAPTQGVAPLDVQFDGTGSHDPDGQVVSYAWDFGDGTTGTGAVVAHQYAAAGRYAATLTVKDDGGAAAQGGVTILVEEALQRIVFVGGIDMSLVPDRGGTRAQAAVKVVDGGGGLVAGATVNGQWTGLVRGTCAGTTDPEGVVALVSRKAKNPGKYVFTVTGIGAEGCTYAAERNVETSDAIESPMTSIASGSQPRVR